LPGYEFAESVATDWGGGQPEPELGTDAFDGVVVGGGIDRLPHSNRYQLTPLGRWVPVIFTKAYGRILAPVLTYLDPALPADLAKQHTLATAWRTLDRELDRFVTGGVAAA